MEAKMITKDGAGDTVGKENDVISQWGWIAKYCKNKGMIESAGLAEKIDNIEKHLYGNERTEAWERFVEEHKNSGDEEINIYLIANRGEFSVPCMKYNFKCKECKFAKIAGECNEKGSLSYMFDRSVTQFLIDKSEQ